LKKIIFLLFIFPIFTSDTKKIFLFKDEIVSETDAFTMFGDSRTHFIYKMFENADWEDENFLGKFKTNCSESKTTIQNAGFGGSTTEDWLTYLKHKDTTKDHFHKKIVLMIGGNDVLRRVKNWMKIFSTDKEKEEDLDLIHSRVKEIVDILVSWDKEIIIQTHYVANPSVKTKYYKEANEAMIGLNERLLKTYGKESTESKISLAILPSHFPSILFVDKIHLNELGYQFHAGVLQKELSRRCFW
jgi:lysophospholipase L1-like esterase